eukprot:gene12340-2991_t
MKALGSLLNVNGEIAHRKRLPEAVKSRRWAYLGHNIRYKGPAKKAMEECERLEKSRCWQGLLAYGCHNFVVVLDPKTVQVIQTFHHYTSAIVKVRWAHDNNNHDLNTPYNMKLAAADQAGHVMVWDVGNGKLLQEFSEPGKPVHEMHWLKNIDAPNSLLLVLHAPGQLVLFNTETNVRLWRKAFSEPLVSFALDPFDPQSMARNPMSSAGNWGTQTIHAKSCSIPSYYW